jgi:hypothetical protein
MPVSSSDPRRIGPILRMSMQEIVQCVCGKKWEISSSKIIFRDIDTLECDCGFEVKSWSGSTIYSMEPADPSAPPTEILTADS